MLFESKDQEQRTLLATILKNATWKEGMLHATLLEPFEQLRRSNRANATKISGKGREIKFWLLR